MYCKILKRNLLLHGGRCLQVLHSLEIALRAMYTCAMRPKWNLHLPLATSLGWQQHKISLLTIPSLVTCLKCCGFFLFRQQIKVQMSLGHWLWVLPLPVPCPKGRVQCRVLLEDNLSSFMKGEIACSLGRREGKVWILPSWDGRKFGSSAPSQMPLGCKRGWTITTFVPGGAVSHSGLQATGKQALKSWLPPSPLNRLRAASLGQQGKKWVYNQILQNVGAEISLLKANAEAAPSKRSHAWFTGIAAALKPFHCPTEEEEESVLNHWAWRNAEGKLHWSGLTVKMRTANSSSTCLVTPVSNLGWFLASAQLSGAEAHNLNIRFESVELWKKPSKDGKLH